MRGTPKSSIFIRISHPAIGVSHSYGNHQFGIEIGCSRTQLAPVDVEIRARKRGDSTALAG